MSRTVRTACCVAGALLVGLLFYQFQGREWLSGKAKSEPGRLSDLRAEKVQRVLEEMEARHREGKVPTKSYLLSEEEINAYLEVKLRERERKEVEAFTVRLKQQSFVAVMKINMDEVQLKADSMTVQLFKALLSGHPTLEVEGRLQVKNGKGTYSVERARLNDIPVPAPLVNLILSAVGKKQNPPFDPTEPFEMPYGITSVDTAPGRVVIRTGEATEG